MADEREEPPALFDDEDETPVSKPEELPESSPVFGETTEISLEDEGPKEDENSVETEQVKLSASEEKDKSSSTASVEVTSVSKSSEASSKPASKSKAEVST